MRKLSLERWLTRAAVQGIDRIELVRPEAAEHERIVDTYPLVDGAGTERLSEIAGALLAVAQDETDLAEARCSFLIAGMRGDGMINSTKVRCDPVRDDGRVDLDAQEEPTKAGAMALQMKLIRDLGNLVVALSAPKRQHEAIDFVVQMLSGELKAQRDENSKLRALVAAKITEDADVTAELLEEQREQSEMQQVLLQNGLGLVKQMIESRQQQTNGAAAPNGHDPNAAGGTPQ
jgi:DNA-binding transcriptional regulator YiaG